MAEPHVCRVNSQTSDAQEECVEVASGGERRGLRSLYASNIVGAQATGRSFVPRRAVEL
jgi:hypothetical protein